MRILPIITAIAVSFLSVACSTPAPPPGVTVVEAGHYHTEACMAEGMARWLREAFPQAEVTAFEDEPPYVTV